MQTPPTQTLTSLPGAAVASAPSTLAVARAGLWALFAGHLVAIWGTQWDIQWHQLIGRDSFWILPHVITYSGVGALVLVSFGVLAWTTARAAREPDTVRILGLAGSRGYHLAAWGIALTVLAAPIDDLWHRLFGLDVTLWSPPHLLGLLGGVVNASGCWLIARETYPAGTRARASALVIAGALVYAGLGVTLQPGIRTAYAHGGVRFFTYAILAALLVPLPLVVTARVSAMRTAPVLSLVAILVVSAAGNAIASAGFAWLRPESALTEELAKDPTSPIAQMHAIARKNGTRPGGHLPSVFAVTLAAGIAMSAVDARRRPVLASLAAAAVFFVGVGIVLARMPALADSLPSAPDVVVAAALTALAAFAGGGLARRVSALLLARSDGKASPLSGR
jgi:hypothetical protein